MMHRIVFVLALLFALPVMAADGDVWSSFTATNSGDYRVVAHLLCENKSANGDCDDFDLTAQVNGTPSFYTLSIVRNDGCLPGEGTVMPKAMHRAGGTEYSLRSTPFVHDGKKSQPFDVEHNFIKATVANIGSCTGLDLAIVLYTER